MTKTEAVIRSILGAVGMNIRPLACSVDIAIDLMFVQGVPMDDILVMEDIYPEVAKLVKNRQGKISSLQAISKRIHRLANLCWDTLVARDLTLEYLGAPLQDIRAPRDVIFYHAAKALYQPVADQLGCSCSSVERNIRTAARVAWQINPCGLQKLAGYPLCAAPSAAAFVSILTTHLLRQQMEKTSR